MVGSSLQESLSSFFKAYSKGYILDIAGGFDDPTFRKTIRENEILILRQDENQFYNKEILTSYKEAHKHQLMPNDKIFVYEDIVYEA